MKKKKYALTLLEIMIVIVLIGLIGSVIGYNMKGSLDEGRAFKTEYAINQITDILMLEVAKGEETIESVIEQKEIHLRNSGLVKDVRKLLKDGWGAPFEITTDGSSIAVSSINLDKYKAIKDKRLGKQSQVAQTDDAAD
jgi:general secretion pathway protein G